MSGSASGSTGSATMADNGTPVVDPNSMDPNANGSTSTLGDVGKGAATGAGAGAMFGPWGAVIGGVIGAVGGLISASDQAGIDNQKAALEQAQAEQVAQREAANDAATRADAFTKAGDVSSEDLAKGEGAGIGSQLAIRQRAEMQISLNDQAAAFQESQYRAGAGMETTLAGNTMTAGYIGAAGNIVKAGSATASYGIGASNGAPQALPNLPGQMEGY